MAKLVIQAFTDAKRSGIPGSDDKMEIKINPQTITKKHEHRYSKYRGINSSKNTATYAYSLAEEISFQLFIVDSELLEEVAIPFIGPKNEPVTQQVKRFLKLCYKMNGNIHAPNFLKIQWSGIDFRCKLKSLDIQYSSYTKEGEPRKATLDVVFIEDVPQSSAALQEEKSSPDLTHIITVKEGDTLPMLTEKTYGTTNKGLYLEIARVNKLNDFRNLQVGERLVFPPLEK